MSQHVCPHVRRNVQCYALQMATLLAHQAQGLAQRKKRQDKSLKSARPQAQDKAVTGQMRSRASDFEIKLIDWRIQHVLMRHWEHLATASNEVLDSWGHCRGLPLAFGWTSLPAVPAKSLTKPNMRRDWLRQPAGAANKKHRGVVSLWLPGCDAINCDASVNLFLTPVGYFDQSLFHVARQELCYALQPTDLLPKWTWVMAAQEEQDTLFISKRPWAQQEACKRA